MTVIGNEIMITEPNYLIQTNPTPQGSNFGQVMNGVETMARAAGNVAGIFDPMGLSAMMGSLENLVQEQMAIQIAMQQVTFESNVSKSDHEMRMAPIRNLRTS